MFYITYKTMTGHIKSIRHGDIDYALNVMRTTFATVLAVCWREA